MSHQTQLILFSGPPGAGKTSVVTAIAQAGARRRRRVGLFVVGDLEGSTEASALRRIGIPVEEAFGNPLSPEKIASEISRFEEEAKLDLLCVEFTGRTSSLAVPVREQLSGQFQHSFSHITSCLVIRPAQAELLWGDQPPSGSTSWDKQLLEADLATTDQILVTCQEWPAPDHVQNWTQRLQQNFPGKPLFELSIQKDAGPPQFLNELLSSPSTAMPQNRNETQHDPRSEHEGTAGMNCRLSVRGDREFLLDDLLLGILIQLQEKLIQARAEILHLKGIGECDEGSAAANVVRTFNIELTTPCGLDTTQADIVINARAFCGRQLLQTAVQESIDEISKLLQVQMEPLNTTSFGS